MLSLLAIVIGCVACHHLPRMLAEAIGTIIGVAFALSSRRAHQALVARASARGCAAAWGRRPTRRERRLLRTSLKASLRSTEFTSLFPGIATRAHRIADSIN